MSKLINSNNKGTNTGKKRGSDLDIKEVVAHGKVQRTLSSILSQVFVIKEPKYYRETVNVFFSSVPIRLSGTHSFQMLIG